MKIKFNSNDNLSLNKPLKCHMMTIIIRAVFEEDGKLYRQVFDECNSVELTYYEKNRDVILNRAKDYYENDKERLRDQARDKYRNLSEEEKNKKREYGKNRYHNMSEEKKQRLKEYQKHYRKAKKSQYNNE